MPKVLKRKQPETEVETQAAKDQQSRSWCFTINNYTEEDIKWIQGLQDHCPTLLVAKEVGESGTPHLQGEVTFASAKRWSAMKKLHGTWHFEVKKSKDFTYTLKKGNEMVVNKHTIKGQRNDLLEATLLIREKGLQAVVDSMPETFIRHHNGLRAYQNAVMPHRNPENPPTIYWFHGQAGSGKTREARQYCIDNDLSFYFKDNTQWWDGYRQQDAVIIDDFDHTSWNYRELLRVLDRYEHQVQIKGGYIPLNSRVIIITCEFHPSRLWNGNTLFQVTRCLQRINEIKLDL